MNFLETCRNFFYISSWNPVEHSVKSWKILECLDLLRNLNDFMELSGLSYSRLSLSRIPRDSLKYFEISVVRHIRFAELRKKLILLTTFNKYMCNWTLEVRDILKILWKRGEIAP